MQCKHFFSLCCGIVVFCFSVQVATAQICCKCGTICRRSCCKTEKALCNVCSSEFNSSVVDTPEEEELDFETYFSSFLASGNFSNQLVKSSSDGDTYLIDMLHQSPEIKFDNIQNPTSGVELIYSTGEIKNGKNTLSKNYKIIDVFNTFSNDVFIHNFLTHGYKGSAPISMIPTLGVIKRSEAFQAAIKVNNFLQINNNDFFIFLHSWFHKGNVALNTNIINQNDVEEKLPGVNYVKDIEVGNEKFKKDYNILNDVFPSTLRLQGFAGIEANFDWEVEFNELDGLYSFYNQDGTTSKARYLKGLVKGKLSKDKKTLRVFLKEDAYLDITTNYLSEPESSFDDEVQYFWLGIPKIQIKSIIKLESMYVNQRERNLNTLFVDYLGNFYFVSYIHTDKYGFYLGENKKREKVKLDDKITEYPKNIQVTQGISLQSSFKMSLYYRDILVYVGIVDGGKVFSF